MSDTEGRIPFQLQAHERALGPQGIQKRFLPVPKVKHLLKRGVSLRKRSKDNRGSKRTTIFCTGGKACVPGMKGQWVVRHEILFKHPVSDPSSKFTCIVLNR